MSNFDFLQKPDEQTMTLWVTLAELFFLDTEPQNYDFDRNVKMLKQAGWSCDKTRETLIKFIAPICGHNLGFLIWPVIGAWSGFDQKALCEKIQSRAIRRAKHPDWHYLVSDWYCERILKTLGMDRLLTQLATAP
jgi:hypothetical protein